MKVAIAGAGGRMGRTLVEGVVASSDLLLAVALEVAGSPLVGQSAAPGSAVLVSDDIGAIADADVLIDFTRPAGTLAHLEQCVRHGRAIVIGTTGFSDEERQRIDAASRNIPIVFSPNMSVGVNVTLKLIELATKALAEDYDIEVLEMHHKHKIDAPSGTALRIGEVIAGAMDQKLDDSAVYSREGVTGERKKKSIGFAVLRGGDVVGEHTVMFAGDGERVEITHRATSRNTFASGALRAARFLIGRPPGLYRMDDVLGLSDVG